MGDISRSVFERKMGLLSYQHIFLLLYFVFKKKIYKVYLTFPSHFCFSFFFRFVSRYVFLVHIGMTSISRDVAIVVSKRGAVGFNSELIVTCLVNKPLSSRNISSNFGVEVSILLVYCYYC